MMARPIGKGVRSEGTMGRCRVSTVISTGIPVVLGDLVKKGVCVLTRVVDELGLVLVELCSRMFMELTFLCCEFNVTLGDDLIASTPLKVTTQIRAINTAYSQCVVVDP
jgi:hypothetical protein